MSHKNETTVGVLRNEAADKVEGMGKGEEKIGVRMLP